MEIEFVGRAVKLVKVIMQIMFFSKRRKNLFSAIKVEFEIEFGMISPPPHSYETVVWLVEQNICERGRQTERKTKRRSERVERTCHLALRNPAAKLRGVGWSGWVSLWWRKGCGDRGGGGWVLTLKCVCDWSAVAGDLLWRGGMREGHARLGCIHIHPLTPTHSRGSETLQIETSPLCPPPCSLDLQILDC